MLRRFLLAPTLAFALGVGLPQGISAQDGVAGPYLAARLAGFSNDYLEAAEYYGRLIARDPSDPGIVENAMVVFAVIGDFDSAAEVAALGNERPNPRQLSELILLIDDLRTERYAQAMERLGDGSVAGPLLEGLLQGWAEVGLGRMGNALAAFDALAQREAFAEFAYIHRAFALAQVGDFENAEAILSGEQYGPPRLGPRGLMARAQMLVQLDRRDQALALLDQALVQRGTAELATLRAEIASGEALAYTTIATPREGMAEAFYTLAAVVNGEAAESYTLIHSRAAMALDPRHVDATILTAEVFDSIGQYRLANQTLDTVPEDHPAFVEAEVARAEVLFADGRETESIDVLKALSAQHPERDLVWSALGDANRRTSNFEDAHAAYTRAIDLKGTPEPRDWFIHYTRGITNERTKRWDEAERDFETALRLRPDQPLVLNYYGYSLVERRERLDDALEMIKKAVEGRPEDGYITDSLGWVYYRLDRFEDAVAPMERAVALEPLDAVINDHLGDVYWKVGRKREAEFQWRRALSFIPEINDTEADPNRIRRKLEVGLDVVLADERAKGGETQ